MSIRTRASSILIVALLSLAAASNASAQTNANTIPQTDADTLTLNVTVRDERGRYVTMLGQQDFKLLDEKTPQPITLFSGDQQPASIGIMIDRSGSLGGGMGHIRRMAVSDALLRFIQATHEGSEYFVVGFNRQPQMVVDWTRDRRAVAEGINRLWETKPLSMTAFYDSCYVGVEKVVRGAHRKHVLLLLTDGQDNNSTYKFAELKRLIEETDVLIYAVGLVDTSADGTAFSAAGLAILKELTTTSGGETWVPSTKSEMSETLERIAVELRTQYVIGFKPTVATKERKWRRLKLEAKPPPTFPPKIKLYTRARQGYYPPLPLP
ncbi:MAG TPA: VWA domain-containing protein [Pyrinomonadaceae bacterium]|jgi:Ca-activated chloride channel family protein